jgi:hypothetical protein
MTRRDLLALFAAFLFGLVLVALCPKARADCGRTRGACYTPAVAVSNYQTYTPAVSAVAYQTVAVPYAVQVPAYSASYQPAASLPPELTLLLQQLSDRAISQEQRLQRLEGPTATANAETTRPGVMPPAQPEARAPSSVWTSCIKCHDGAAAQADGHVLFANGLPTHWDAPTLLEVVDRVTRPPDAKGAMPKGGPAFTGEQVEAVLNETKRMAAVAAK